MLSRTLKLSKAALSWKVRTSPIWQIRSGNARVTSTPCTSTRPCVAGAIPVITSNSVVLPAPFGPPMPSTSPGRTESDSPSTAFSEP